MQRTGDKSSYPRGGNAAERLRDLLERRMPRDEADAELERQTNIKPDDEKGLNKGTPKRKGS
jgi:hypothetical protein